MIQKKREPRKGTVVASDVSICGCGGKGGMGGAYDWYYIVLDGFGGGYYVEETGEVELDWMRCC